MRFDATAVKSALGAPGKLLSSLSFSVLSLVLLISSLLLLLLSLLLSLLSHSPPPPLPFGDLPCRDSGLRPPEQHLLCAASRVVLTSCQTTACSSLSSFGPSAPPPERSRRWPEPWGYPGGGSPVPALRSNFEVTLTRARRQSDGSVCISGLCRLARTRSSSPIRDPFLEGWGLEPVV